MHVGIELINSIPSSTLYDILSDKSSHFINLIIKNVRHCVEQIVVPTRYGSDDPSLWKGCQESSDLFTGFP
jgi:hypothetical protein